MACFRPMEAWKSKHINPTGRRSLVFNSAHSDDPDAPMRIKCGVCIGCRMDKANEWALRCMHESEYHEENYFITLTYNEESLWSRDNPMSLDYRDIQKFHKRLRKRMSSFRFYIAGEYGPKNGRPHWHGLYFGLSIPDLQEAQLSPRSDVYYSSELLNDIWGQGFVTIGQLTPESAAYTARYCFKKQRGETVNVHDHGLNVATGESERLFWTNEETGEVLPLKPEFCAMSRRPGIGGQWIEDNLEDTYKDDFVVFKGRERAVPRYYDKYMEKLDPWKFDEIKMDRVEKARQLEEDRDRLRVMETVKQLKADKLVRYV